MTTITVHGFHLDGYGHVNNARYLEFLEAARWDQLHAHQDLNWWHDQGYAFVIANIDISFRRPANLGDRLDVTVALGDLGETSARVMQEIRHTTGELVVDAALVCVILDTGTGQTVPITGEVRKRLEALAETLNNPPDAS
jgi:thioesterase-3